MTLTVHAPHGAEFEMEEVKTKKGAESLGEVPILVWKSASAAIAHYGEQGIINMLDGTSLRVAAQSIARRYKLAKKSDDEIAQAQIDYKPGNRSSAPSTPAGRAAKAAKSATEKLGGSDTVANLLDLISSGKLSPEQLDGLMASVQ